MADIAVYPNDIYLVRIIRFTENKMTMKYYTFEILFEKEPNDEGYLAYSPTLPGCFSNGKTIEETKRNFSEAVEQHLESLLKHGKTISPEITHVAHNGKLKESFSLVV